MVRIWTTDTAPDNQRLDHWSDAVFADASRDESYLSTEGAVQRRIESRQDKCADAE